MASSTALINKHLKKLVYIDKNNYRYHNDRMINFDTNRGIAVKEVIVCFTNVSTSEGNF